jgi:multiple sugar transport system permease protein
VAQTAVKTGTASPASAPKAPRRRRHVLREMRREWTAYLMNAPGLAVFAVFVVYSVYSSIYMSFHQWDLLDPQTKFIGLQNYREALHDSVFWSSLWHAVYFTLGTAWAQMAIGLFLAILLNAQIRGLGLFRTAYYLPVITPIVVAAIIWKWVYNADYGLANYYLLKFHVISHPLLWLSDKNLAMPAVIVMTVWQAVGFNMIIYLAGLQSIPVELYEAADVDGATGWQRFRRITFPLLLPTTFFLLIINTIGAMKAFPQIFIMTNGGPPGPGGATTTVVYWIYTQAFTFFRMGYASALAYILFILLFAVSFLQFRWYRKRVEEVD